MPKTLTVVIGSQPFIMASEIPRQEDVWTKLLARLAKCSADKSEAIDWQKEENEIEAKVHQFCRTETDKTSLEKLAGFCRVFAAYKAKRNKLNLPPESQKDTDVQKKILRAVPCGVMALIVAGLENNADHDTHLIDASIRDLVKDTATRAAAMKDLVETMKRMVEPGAPASGTDQRREDEKAKRRSNVITACLKYLRLETESELLLPPPPMLSYMYKEISDIEKKLQLGLRNNSSYITNHGSITDTLNNLRTKLIEKMEDVMGCSDNKGEQMSGAKAAKPKGVMKGPPFYFLSLTGENEWNIKRQPGDSGSQVLLSPYLLCPGDSQWEWQNWQQNLRTFSPTLETEMISMTNVFVEFEPQRQMAMYKHKKLWKRAAKAKITPYPGVLVFTMGSIQWDLKGLDNQSDSRDGRVEHRFLIPFGSIVRWKEIPGAGDKGSYLIIQTQDMNYRFYPICKDCKPFLERFVGSRAKQDDDHKMCELLRAEKMRKLEKNAVSVVDDMIEKQSFPARKPNCPSFDFYSDCFESFFKRVIVKNNREIKKTLERATERLCGLREEKKESSDLHKWNVWLLEAMRRFCVRKPEYVAIVLKKADALRVRKEDAKDAIAEFVELFTRDDEVLITNGLKNQAAQLRKAVCGTEKENGTWSYSNYSLDRIRRIIPRDDLDIIDKGRCRYAAAFKKYLRSMYTGETISLMEIENDGTLDLTTDSS